MATGSHYAACGKATSFAWRAVEGGWECSVPMRAIDKSAYFEFRPISMDGKFTIVGSRFYNPTNTPILSMARR